MNKSNKQSGFAHVAVLVIVIVIGVVVFAAWKVTSKKAPEPSVNNSQEKSSEVSSNMPEPSNKIVMKSIGFKLDYYNEATNKAGDMEFTKIPLNFNQIWGDFGQQDPRSPNDPSKRNPQPTYILPLGTKVEALVDGVVEDVRQIYSGDYTIMIRPSGSDLMFETEHVDSPLVKKGDLVKSGQVIAQVSKHDSQYHAGFGVLEIGVLGQSGNRPSHTCPYSYLDDSVKDEMLKKITNVHNAWEKYLGKDVYPDKSELPGCTTLAPFVE
jgi:hypothetical protein